MAFDEAPKLQKKIENVATIKKQPKTVKKSSKIVTKRLTHEVNNENKFSWIIDT